MPDPKMVSEREAVARERKAFMAGACHGHYYGDERHEAEARHRYPLPKVERPRVVQDCEGTCWRVVNGMVERSKGNEVWHASIVATAERVRIIADLLAHPTETVEDA